MKPAVPFLAVLITIGCPGLTKVRAEEVKKTGGYVSMAATTAESNVRREGDKVYIPGLEQATWGRGGRTNSVMACLSHALDVTGEKVSYEHLMGVSGAAFRLQVAQPRWCPSSPHANCGFNCIEPAMAALDYDWVEICGGKADAQAIARAKQATMQLIDQGRPVLYGSEECGIIVGYTNGGEQLLVRPYGAKLDGYVQMKGWPWGVQKLVRGKPAPPRREIVLQSLTRAVEVANTSSYGDDRIVYASGFAAYEAWIAGLLDDQRFKAMGDAFFNQALGNAWTYDSLADARDAASKYLTSIATDFRGPTAERLGKAADLYSQINKALVTERDGAKCIYQMYPWELKELSNWTKQLRLAEVAALKDALALERQAIAEIEKALAAEEIKVSAARKERVEKSSKGTKMNAEQYPEVVLEDAVNEFRQLMTSA